MQIKYWFYDDNTEAIEEDVFETDDTDLMFFIDEFIDHLIRLQTLGVNNIKFDDTILDGNEEIKDFEDMVNFQKIIRGVNE